MIRETFLWVEKYRPKKITDCILPESIKNTFIEFVGQKDIPNLLLAGGSGVGKTTVARALCEEIHADYILINGSEESGIDVLRNKIKQFASTVSLQSGSKVVILDEADYLNPQSTQPALRGFIEEFHRNCRFIFTCNFKNRIIPALHSRCSVVDFIISKNDKPALGMEMLTNVKRILNKEEVEYEESVLVQLILKYFPDFRRVINELQKYSLNGIIDEDILKQSSDENFNELFVALKGKDFSGMRKWVAQNIDNDHVRLYRQIYDTLNNRFEKKSIPQAVLTIANYSYMSAFVADQEVNMVACLTEIMMDSEFV